MNREEAKEMWPIIKAYAEGHDVKFCGEPHPYPTFAWEPANYEVVPKPNWWLHMESDGEMTIYQMQTEKELLLEVYKAAKLFKYVYEKTGVVDYAQLELNIMAYDDLMYDMSYEVVPKPKPIDLSVLIESGIDCEFSDYKDFDIQHVGALANITPANEYKMTDGTSFRHCRTRMNHIHYWGGGKCPLPDGLEIRIHFSGPTTNDLKVVNHGYRWFDDEVVGFEVLGLADGWCWPWECDK